MMIELVTSKNCLEDVGEYSTSGCAYSVLKLSNGYVTGHINPYIGGDGETTMPWDELRKYLSNDGYVNAFEADSVVWKSCLELNVPGLANPVSETILYGDTIVNELKWKIVNISVASVISKAKGLVRTENRKVIFMPYPGYENFYIQEYSEVETELYNFSLEVGEGSIYGGIVVEIDSIDLNDEKKHKYMVFDQFYNEVEGLGNISSDPFDMLFIHNLMVPSSPTLMCCHVNGELLYMNPDYLDCEGNKVSNEIIGNISPKSRISFVDSQLNISFDNDALFDVTVYNMQGMMLLKKKNNRNKMFADLSSLPKGVYIVRVNSGNYVYSEKIAK